MTAARPGTRAPHRSPRERLDLPASGRSGPPPRWPLDDPPTGAEAKRWRQAWRLPQAVAWEQMRCERLVARWVRLLGNVESHEPDRYLLAEVRQSEDRLGLSPAAMARLGWSISDDAPAAPVDERRRAIRQRVGLGDDGEPVALRAVEP